MTRALVLLSLLVACSAPPPRPVPECRCGLACYLLRHMRCYEGRTRESGLTCEAYCELAASGGVELAGDPECLARAERCSQVIACGKWIQCANPLSPACGLVVPE